MIGVVKVGSWALSRRVLAAAPRDVQRAISVAIRQEALYFVAQAKRGIRTQAPGGRRFRPLSPNTLKVRRFLGFRGTKALFVRGDLRNSITMVPLGTSSAFVGVHRGARTRDGKDLVNVARVHEFGAGPFAIRVTPKMRAFLRAAGIVGGTAGSTTGAAAPGLDVIIVRIPARPFLGPILDAHFRGPTARLRLQGRISRALGGRFGSSGSPPPSATS